MTNTAVTIALLDTIQDAFNRQDVDGILDHFSEDCIWVMARGPAVPEGRVCHGKAEIAEVLAARYALIPDMRWVEMQHFIAADGARAASEWRVQGTPADGPAVDWLGCDLWTFRDGLVVRKDTYWKYIEER